MWLKMQYKALCNSSQKEQDTWYVLGQMNIVDILDGALLFDPIILTVTSYK